MISEMRRQGGAMAASSMIDWWVIAPAIPPLSVPLFLRLLFLPAGAFLLPLGAGAASDGYDLLKIKSHRITPVRRRSVANR